MAGRLFLILPALVAFLVGAVPALAWTWPVDGPVLQPFGFGGDPYAAGQHRGVDVGAGAGEPVAAPASGVVAFAGTVPRAGRTVTIHTADGYAVTLLHLGAVAVTRGEAVIEGQVVGAVGPTGESEHSEPYVHLGIRVAADPQGYVDPLAFLPSRAGSPPAELAEPAEPQPVESERGDEAESAPALAPDQPNDPVEQAQPGVPAAEPVVAAPPPPPTEAPAPAELVAAPVASVPGAGSFSPPGDAEPFAQPAVAEPLTLPASAEPKTQPAVTDPPAPSISTADRPPSSSAAPAEQTEPESAVRRKRAREATGPDTPVGQRPRSVAAGHRAAGGQTGGTVSPIHEEESAVARPGGDRVYVPADPVTLALLAGLGISLLVLRRPAGGAPEQPAPDPSAPPGPVRGIITIGAPRGSSLRRRRPIRRPERRNARRIIASDDLLRHDADLLRQFDAAHRPCILDDRRGRRRAPPPPAR